MQIQLFELRKSRNVFHSGVRDPRVSRRQVQQGNTAPMLSACRSTCSSLHRESFNPHRFQIKIRHARHIRKSAITCVRCLESNVTKRGEGACFSSVPFFGCSRRFAHAGHRWLAAAEASIGMCETLHDAGVHDHTGCSGNHCHNTYHTTPHTLLAIQPLPHTCATAHHPGCIAGRFLRWLPR